MNLDVFAGETALEQLMETGLVADDFDVVLGASGGPKWFILFGLDKVIIPEFFKDRKKPLDLVGSSAGAFRFACLAQNDPVDAMNILAQRYSHTIYSEKPDIHEISDKAEDLLREILQGERLNQILVNPSIRAHFITVRCKGLIARERQPGLTMGLLSSAVSNSISREHLGKYYTRVVFSAPDSDLHITDPCNIPTEVVTMNKDNLYDALLASGSIPGVLRGIADIAGAGPGMYRDGGIVDYHFDFNFPNRKGLTLYPHFYAKPTPGWFDKMSKRRPHKSSYDNAVILAPSKEFVAQLPKGRIADRKDFEAMPAEERIPYWQTILKEGEKLAQDFMELTNPATLKKHIKPLSFKTKKRKSSR